MKCNIEISITQTAIDKCEYYEKINLMGKIFEMHFFIFLKSLVCQLCCGEIGLAIWQCVTKL